MKSKLEFLKGIMSTHYDILKSILAYYYNDKEKVIYDTDDDVTMKFDSFGFMIRMQSPESTATRTEFIDGVATWTIVDNDGQTNILKFDIGKTPQIPFECGIL